MIKKTIQFKDLDGNPLVQDFWFNLRADELTELEFSMKGGLSTYFESVIENQDAGAMIAAFKDIVRRSVGKRSSDNVSFDKSPEISNKFINSDAYTVLFKEMLGADAPDDAFTNFLRGMVPADVAEQIPDDVKLPGTPTNGPKTVDQYSRQELLDMSDEEFDAVAGTNTRAMSKDTLTVAMQRRNRQA